jgi:predicted transcriptional regulator
MSSVEKIIEQVKERVARLQRMHIEVAEKQAACTKALQEEAELRGKICASSALRKRLEVEQAELLERIKCHEDVDTFIMDHFEATKLETEVMTGAFGVQREVKFAVKK